MEKWLYLAIRGKVSRFTGASEMLKDTSPICTASISIIGLRRSERLRRIPDRNVPPPAYFSSLGVSVVPLSDLKKTFEASEE